MQYIRETDILQQQSTTIYKLYFKPAFLNRWAAAHYQAIL